MSLLQKYLLLHHQSHNIRLLYIVGTDYGVPGGWFAGGGAASLR